MEVTNEYWLIFDSLLKVSTGGILVLASLWVSRAWHEHSNRHNKDTPQKRKIQLLEDISSEVGHVNHSFAKYSALVIESTRFGEHWPAARKQELNSINSELVLEFEKLSAAEAKLLMLGEKTMEKTLRLYGAKIAFFRKQVYVGRQDISEQEIADLKSTIMKLREQFYDILSRRYDRLLATK
ncbi:MAG: energy transducer TonB [Alteromonadaceae bacterium]|nr:MAG: energy transducer TonB [Alteromonadaceae bacterium]